MVVVCAVAAVAAIATAAVATVAVAVVHCYHIVYSTSAITRIGSRARTRVRIRAHVFVDSSAQLSSAQAKRPGVFSADKEMKLTTPPNYNTETRNQLTRLATSLSSDPRPENIFSHLTRPLLFYV